MAFPDFGSPSPTKPNEGKTPKGGLGEMMKSLLGGGAGQAPQGPEMPPGAPGMPPGIPGQPPMPGPGGPMQGAGLPQPSISPEEYQAILEQIKGELMKDIAGQTGQQDRMFAASAGLSRYKPMQGGIMTPTGPPMNGMSQDVAYPPGMDRQGLERWRQTGNPNPGMGRTPPPPPPGVLRPDQFIQPGALGSDMELTPAERARRGLR